MRIKNRSKDCRRNYANLKLQKNLSARLYERSLRIDLNQSQMATFCLLLAIDNGELDEDRLRRSLPVFRGVMSSLDQVSSWVIRVAPSTGDRLDAQMHRNGGVVWCSQQRFLHHLVTIGFDYLNRLNLSHCDQDELAHERLRLEYDLSQIERRRQYEEQQQQQEKTA